MRSNSLRALSLFIALSALACTPKSVPRHQKAIDEERTRPIHSSDYVSHENEQSSSRYSQLHFEIGKLIQEGSSSSLTKAYSLLKVELYDRGLDDKVVYTSPSYGAFLEQLVQVFLKSKTEVSALRKEIKKDFYAAFLADCLDVRDGTCEYLANALVLEKNTTTILLAIADTTIDIALKLKILGAAYDLKSRRGDARLDDSYFDTALLALSMVERNELVMDKKLVRRHLVNLLALNANVDWKNPTSKSTERFAETAPWNFTKNSSKTLDDLRKQLIPFLPIYSERSSDAREGMKQIVSARVTGLKRQNKDLSEYPAFADVEIDSILRLNPTVAYLATELYFQNITITDANTFINNIKWKGSFVDELFVASKTLVRWDIAQLSISSTEKLNVKFSEQATKTNPFFQETLEWAKTLIPSWTEFHTVRLWSIKSLLESNIQHSNTQGEEMLREFFTAINRNILKTTVFPNMMAFAYYMAKTEWSAEIQIFWYRFSLDTTLIMDYLMTGQYQYPWFNFTNLKESTGYRIEEKTTLYRTEMLDALYYFFTTRTHEVYDIDADDFLATTAETIFKKRRQNYEKTIETQKNIYLPDNTLPSRFVSWCEGLKKGEPVEENLNFYDTGDYLTPFNNALKVSPGNKRRSFFFGDWYEGSWQDGVIGESALTTLDRYRLEFEPIYAALLNFKNVTERIGQKNKDLRIGTLSQINDLLADYERLKMQYLGLTKHIRAKYDDCLFVAHEEAKRRARESAYAQYEYFAKILHPLMSAVQNEEISVADANLIIQDFHEYKKGVFDEIIRTNSGEAIAVLSKLTYFVRNRDFLIRGKEYSHPLLGELKVEPIVGSQLIITIPENFLSDQENNIFIGRTVYTPDYMKINYENDADAFARSITIKTTDEGRGALSDHRFTSWDQYDAKKYAEYMRYVVEYEVQMLQMPDQVFVDVTKAGCMTNKASELSKDCIRKEKPTIEPLLSVMRKIIDAYRLTEEDQAYFLMTNNQGWVDSPALESVIKFDPTVPYDFQANSLPYTELAGVFDLPRVMLDSDYLGFSFITDWEVELHKNSDRPGNFSCEGNRSGCYWKNERMQAREMFLARAKKPKLIYNIDLSIIEGDYQLIKDRVVRKYQRVSDLEKNRITYLENVKSDGEPWGDKMLINMFLPPSDIQPISRRYLNYSRDQEIFFDELTEGFFNREHDWSQYIIQ